MIFAFQLCQFRLKSSRIVPTYDHSINDLDCSNKLAAHTFDRTAVMAWSFIWNSGIDEK